MCPGLRTVEEWLAFHRLDICSVSSPSFVGLADALFSTGGQTPSGKDVLLSGLMQQGLRLVN